MGAVGATSTIWTESGELVEVFAARSDARAWNVYLPSARSSGGWRLNAPVVGSANVEARTTPRLSRRSTLALGSVVPTRWGRRTEVIPSPTRPVSSAGEIENVGTAGGTVSIVRLIVASDRAALPAASVARVWIVYVPSNRLVCGWIEYAPVTGSDTVEFRTEPELSSSTRTLGSVMPVKWGRRTLVIPSPLEPVSSLDSRFNVGVVGAWVSIVTGSGCPSGPVLPATST